MSEPVQPSSALDEEIARAELYGLLSQLYYAPPSGELLDALRVAVTDAPAQGGFLEEPWRALVGAARQKSEAEISGEYDALFGGVGKPDIFLFGSHHLVGYLNERPLSKLRDDLAALGLTRDEGMTDTEDHVAYLFEVMRYLIAGDDAAVSNLTRQREFFAQHLQPWIHSLCDAVSAHPRAVFYRALADFTRAFVSVESQGFDMVD
jgi:TorA maturation chaperone TorD